MVDLSETLVNTNSPDAGDARHVAKMPKSLYRYVFTNSKRAVRSDYADAGIGRTVPGFP